MSEHNIISPSSAHQWMRCPASVYWRSRYPDEGSDSAAEGTLAHAVAAALITDNPPPEHTLEMREYVDIYVARVQNLIAMSSDSMVENFLPCSLLGEHGGGTPDFVAVIGNVLHVHDLKYGYLPVLAQHNPQLLIYAYSAYDIMTTICGVEINTICMAIHQPRRGVYDDWVISSEELIGQMHIISEAAQRAIECSSMSDEPDVSYYCPGADQCRYCPHRNVCHSREVDCRTAALTCQTTTLDELTDPARIALLMSYEDKLTQWFNDLRSRALNLALSGVEVPGYKLVQGRAGNRKWVDESKAENTMKRLKLKEKERYKYSLISPTQAEKILVDKPNSWERLKSLVIREPGVITLAPISDKRETVAINSWLE